MPCGDFDRLQQPDNTPLGIKTTAGVCAPLNVSWVLDRSQLRVAHIACLTTSAQVKPAGDGTLNVTRDSSGRVTSARWDATSGEDWTQSFTWSSNGELLFWRRDFLGNSEDVTESFTWSSAGEVLFWQRDFLGGTTDQTVSVTYGSGGVVSNVSTSGAPGAVVIDNCPP